MSDPIEQHLPVVQPPVPVAPSVPEIEALTRSVRGLKIWLGILTAIVILSLLVSCGAIGASVFFGGLFFDEVDMRVPQEELDATTEAFETAYGDNIEDLNVRAVALDYSSFGPDVYMGESGVEEGIAVECRLADPAVTIADMIAWSYGMDAYSTGMIPVAGPLTSRLEQEQIDKLLAAYLQETDAPVGSILRYTDRDPWMYTDDGTFRDTIAIDGVEYRTSDLWSVMDGYIVEGDSVNIEEPQAYDRTCYIFREDPETGEWEFLRTEPGYTMW